MTIKRTITLCSSFIFLGVLFDVATVSAAVQGKWVNSGTIEIGGTQYIDDKPDDSDRSYYKDGGGKCSSRSVIQEISTDNTSARLYPLKTHSSGLGCEPDKSRGEDVAFDPATIADATSSKTTDDESSNSCESKGTALAWIFCPVIKLLDVTMNIVDTQIQAMLDVDTNKFLNEDIKQSWATIRNIAYIILIPITLVMVIGTAIGSSMIDAYTVKKAMPRLAIAVVFIALSFEICSFLILLFNTVGYGTIGLMTAPFGDQISTLSLADLFGTSRDGVSGGVLSFLLLLPKLLILGPAILLLLWFFGTTFLLFAGAAFIVLMLRQLFVVGLVLVAPLAILAWIFPGNDKLWKSWWGMFSKLLIMFPLIMGIIAVGRIFAVIIDEERGGGLEGSLIAPFAKLAAYMLPYAFIPFTFKFAGGIFANIAGVVNDKEKGLFDRQKKKRAENWQGWRAGTKAPPGLKGNNVVARGLRRTGIGVGAGWKGRAGFGARGDAATYTAQTTEADKVANTEAFKANIENDNILRAAASGTTRAEAIENMHRNFGVTREEAARHVDQAQATIGLGRAQQIAAAKQLVMTGTGYDDARQMVRTLGIAAGGSQNMAESLAGFANANTKRVGRSDLAPGFGELNTLVQQESGARGSVVQDQLDHAYDEAIRTQGMGAIIGGKFNGVRNTAPAMIRRIRDAEVAVNAAHASGDANAIAVSERRYKQVMASTSAAVDLAGQVSPEAGQYLADNVLNAPTTVLGQTTTVSRRIDHLRPDADFGQMHREYVTQQGQQAAAAQATQAAHQAAQAAAQAAGQAAGQQQPPIGGVPPIVGSDLRIKQNVQFFKMNEDGLRLYRFQYLNSDVVFIGVMAQDVLKFRPEAVKVDAFGYYQVNYEVLGIKLLKV